VVPLARALGVAVEVRPELAPDAEKRRTLALLRELPEDALVCTHREVFERLFGHELACDKAGGWRVERRGRRWMASAYVPPPTLGARARRPAAVV
jgi:hypothetical protein